MYACRAGHSTIRRNRKRISGGVHWSAIRGAFCLGSDDDRSDPVWKADASCVGGVVYLQASSPIITAAISNKGTVPLVSVSP